MKISEANKNTLRMPLIWLAGMLVILAIQVAGNIYIGNEIVEQPYYYCSFIWGAFAVLCAKFEAYFYEYASRDNSDKPNLHYLLWFTRAVVIIPIWVLTDWKAVLCYGAIFPFLHDGSYYAQRERIKPGTYPKKWMAQSTTSTAWTDKFLTPLSRIVLFILAILGLIILRYRIL